MILATDMYNIPDPSTAGAFLYQALPGAVAGPDFPQAAVDSNFPGWGAGFVAIALLFFVFTTVMAYYYMAETHIAYIDRTSVVKGKSVLVRVDLGVGRRLK